MARTLNILIAGGAGQVGQELLRSEWPEHVVLHAPGRTDLDIADAVSVRSVMEGVQFDAVINAAAYTAVDKAEDDIADAYLVNTVGPAILAAETSRAGVPLVHVSTDYVFDGEASGYYSEDADVSPLGVYGASKLAGEVAVRIGNPRSVVLRTAWVVSPFRSNFVKTMLRLGAQHASLRVVADQVGCPTNAADIAAALRVITLRLISDGDAPVGVYHFVNDGEASWHELAAYTFSKWPEAERPDVIAIRSDEYPTRAVRPKNSRLSSARLQEHFQIKPRAWKDAVHDVIAELSHGGAK